MTDKIRIKDARRFIDQLELEGKIETVKDMLAVLIADSWCPAEIEFMQKNVREFMESYPEGYTVNKN